MLDSSIINQLETLKIVSCQYLESIEIWCGGLFLLIEKDALEIVAEYSEELVGKLCTTEITFIDNCF